MRNKKKKKLEFSDKEKGRVTYQQWRAARACDPAPLLNAFTI